MSNVLSEWARDVAPIATPHLPPPTAHPPPPPDQGSRLGDADGFTIDSLLKLTHTRTTVTAKGGKKETVLDFIVGYLLNRGEGDVAVSGVEGWGCV